MGPTSDAPGNPSPWTSRQNPCVYCGQVISRTEERCPHCRTSFSLAVRKASREVVGNWFYLDSRNPSGRGVTLETLIKMIEKGRIKPDSIVRGPTTHHDWMFAAETPRLAKYLGMCPHCFSEAKPEDTFCTRCQLNMNNRPAEPRPGIPPDLVKEPVHKTAYEMEKELARTVTAKTEDETLGPPPSQPQPMVAATDAFASPKSGPRAEATSAAVAAAAAMASPATPSGDRQSRILPAGQRKKVSVWLVLVLTWVTLIPVVLLCLFTDLPQIFVSAETHNKLRSAFGLGATPGPEDGGTDTKANDEWVNQKLREADGAVKAQQFGRAIEIYDAVFAKTGDKMWQDRRESVVKQKAEADRRDRLAKIKGHLETADKLAGEGHYDDALARLRSIGSDDRTMLAALKGPGGEPAGVNVEKMEEAIRGLQKQAADQKTQDDQLVAQLNRAAQLKTAKRYADALQLYRQIATAFPAELIQKHLNLDQELLALAKLTTPATPTTPTTPTPTTPTTPTTPGTTVTSTNMTPEQATAAVADLLTQSAALEKTQKLAEALAKLEEVKQNFEQKYWPEGLDERIEKVKAKKSALEFFGLDTPKTPAPKTPAPGDPKPPAGTTPPVKTPAPKTP